VTESTAMSHVRLARLILADLFGPPARRAFAVRLWDGTYDGPAAMAAPPFTLVLRRPGALRRMLLPPSELAIGEAYVRDDFDIEGDIEAAVASSGLITGALRAPAALARAAARLMQLPHDDVPDDVADHPRPALHRFGAPHSRARDAAAVRFHYDAGADFWRLWLDRRMVYSCAYFETGAEDLDTAQAAKLEHICRKLRLAPGERLLDIGCGWGGLVQYAAARYGVQAVGITLSAPQAAYARQRIAAAGLRDRVRIELCDYRDVPGRAAFDKVVSVGMFEHVGRAQLPRYFAQAYRLLRPGGIFLHHGIVTIATRRPRDLVGRLMQRVWKEGGFVWGHVFPDAELVTPAEVVRQAEAAGFETRDVESLREHYALTLRHWLRGLEAHHEEAVRVVGEPAWRVWRLNMAGCARAFATGRLGVIQTVSSKTHAGGRCELPATRADLYREASTGREAAAVL
jgi:cyclopropane-fatty-acyl-phospholipid synthase